MLKVVIADDESWIVESLKAMINWNDYGFVIAGCAYNGVEALKLIEELKPDVVFTDIRMPGISGLELIQKVRDELSMNTQFVIISGYAEFAYAQKAINHGAMRYCLKPFDKSELHEILTKAGKLINASLDAKACSLLDAIAGTGSDDSSEVIKALKEMGLEWDEAKGLVIVVTIGSSEPKPFDGIKHVMLKIGIRKYIYIFEGDNVDKVRNLTVNTNFENIQGIGISGVTTKVCLLKEAYNSANEAAYQFFINGDYGLHESILLKQVDINAVILKIEETINNNDIKEFEKTIELLKKYCKEEKFCIKHAFQTINSTMQYMSRITEEYDEYYVYSYEQLVDTYSNALNMLDHLKLLVIKQLGGNFDNKPMHSENETFKPIVEYINENYWQDLTIQLLSQKYYISVSYLCQLFKKETGSTFTNYISDLRINCACEMLKKSDIPVFEIGKKVGYRDYFYFSKLFKKITGKTPTQFRENR